MQAELFIVTNLTLTTEITSEVDVYMHCNSERQIFLMSLCANGHVHLKTRWLPDLRRLDELTSERLFFFFCE